MNERAGVIVGEIRRRVVVVVVVGDDLEVGLTERSMSETQARGPSGYVV